MKKRVLTGLQPTNNLHIGNYIGCIKQVENLIHQDNEIFLFIPDLHGLTSSTKIESSFDVLRVLIATCGTNIRYYIQSQHLEIPYMSWVLSCNTPTGQLFRMTQFKSKESHDINSGYLYYPILMAADILSIDANEVPVGVDQKQHLELTRDVCDYFNNKYKTKFFTKPNPMLYESLKIQSLQDPDKKMSKSDPNESSCIFLNDSADTIRNKIKKAVTDPELMPKNIQSIEETRKGIFNLCLIYKEIANVEFSFIEENFGGGYTSKFKESLTDVLIEFTSKIQNNISKISDKDIHNILKRDFDYVHGIISTKTKQMKELLGLF